MADRSQKYDRQLRLWGQHGQASLEAAKICLINSSATGAEILKNLVLPGIGSFTIMDDKLVQASDLGSSFFVTASSVGQPRAKVVTELVQELNEYVEGSYIEENAEKVLESHPEVFFPFTLIIATQLPEEPLRKLAALCWQRNIPLLIAHTYGLFGYVRVAVPEHRVVESRPEVTLDDLRVTNPFPELLEYARSFDLSTADGHAHAHIPYVVILIQLLEQFKAQHDGRIPRSRQEKDQFKQMIRSAARTHMEENFDEALKASNRLVVPYSVPSEVWAVLDSERCSALSPDSPPFWIIAAAVAGFVANEGAGTLPLAGAIPDMTSTTESYIALQKLYLDKAQRDVTAVAARVSTLLRQLGKPVESIPLEEIRTFCRNIQYIRCQHYHSLEHEYSSEAQQRDSLIWSIEQPDSAGLVYPLLRAAQLFYSRHHTPRRYPGQLDADLDTDIAALRSLLPPLLASLGLPPSAVSDDHLAEMCRFGAAELHPIAALIGGVASQEAIKLITHQFVPLNNTFLYNGISCTSVSLNL